MGIPPKIKRAGSKIFPRPGSLYIWCRCNIEMNFFFHQILQEMSHHNILKLHHAYPAFDRYYLVMELACGGELFEDLVSRNAFSESTAREVMLQLFSGVQYIHSLRIVHRVRKVTYITGLDSYKILENCPPTLPPSQTICPQVRSYSGTRSIRTPRLGQLGKCQSAEREIAGSNPGRSNTKGL